MDLTILQQQQKHMFLVSYGTDTPLMPADC